MDESGCAGLTMTVGSDLIRASSPQAMTCLSALLATMLLSAPSAAPDLTGTWQLHLEPDLSGHPRTVECRLKQEPRRLTATCAGRATMNGAVSGRTVTFEHQTTEDDEVTVYTRKLDDRATYIEGTWHVAGPNDRHGKFQARKQ
jgi:cytochrome oxidase assembly protein ShyY1